MKIGDRITDARLRAGLTPEELGAKIHKSRATIYRYESDDIDIPLSIISNIAEVLNVSPGYLMGWTDDPNWYTAEEVKQSYYDTMPQPPAPPAPKTEQGIYAGLFVDALTPEEQQRAVDLLKVAFPKNEHDKIV